MSDADSGVIAFIRRARDPSEYLVVVCNFTPIPRYDYRLGVPEKTVFREMLNSDSGMYWGSNVGNAGWAVAEEHIVNQWPCSLKVSLPPLGLLVFKPQRKTKETGREKNASSVKGTKERPAQGTNQSPQVPGPPLQRPASSTARESAPQHPSVRTGMSGR
jgi:1,4-alpha-glucan branching enzyme